MGSLGSPTFPEDGPSHHNGAEVTYLDGHVPVPLNGIFSLTPKASQRAELQPQSRG